MYNLDPWQKFKFKFEKRAAAGESLKSKSDAVQKMRVHPCSPRLECFDIKEEAGFQQQTNISGLNHLPLKIAIKEKSIRNVCVEGKPCRRKGKAYASSRLRKIG